MGRAKGSKNKKAVKKVAAKKTKKQARVVSGVENTNGEVSNS